MKVYFLLITICLGLEVISSHPTYEKSTSKDFSDDNPELADRNSPVRIKVRTYMHTLVADFKDIVYKTLSKLPQTEDYDESRKILFNFLTTINLYIGPLEDCVFNIIDLTFHLNKAEKLLQRPIVTEARRETYRLLMESGWRTYRQEKFHKIWDSFTNGEMGPMDDVNGDYCELN